MKGRHLTSIILLMVAFFTLFPTSASAEEFDTGNCSVNHIVLMEADSGNILVQKNAKEKAYPASTTKIMTCILALEKGNLDDMVTLGEEVWRGFGSQSSLVGFKEGERVTLRDLVYGLMLSSGNDAAAAIAVHISGSCAEFANLMNQKAQELGMKDTHFVNPHGKHDDEHYTTAYDMALLTQYAMKNEQFAKIVGTKTYPLEPSNRRNSSILLQNTNKLIYTKPETTHSYEYRYATGVKTGDTNQALRCLVATATKDGKTLIAVLLRDEPNDNRFNVAASLFEWGFSNSITVDASTLGLPTTLERTVSSASFSDPDGGLLKIQLDLRGKTFTGTQDQIDMIKNDPSCVEIVTTFADNALIAPIREGEVLGTASFLMNGVSLFNVDLVAPRAVESLSATPLPSGTIGFQQNLINEGNSLVFWILIAVLILIIILVIRYLQFRGYRKRGLRRSRNRNLRRAAPSRSVSSRRYR